MSDLIRRADAREALREVDAWTMPIAHAINALPAVTVGVKPLNWHEGDEPDEWKSGPYDVWCELGKFQLYYWSIVLGEPHETADAAKAAAYAHHRARILAAIEPVAVPDPAAIREAALREAAETARKTVECCQSCASVEIAILALIQKGPTNA